jgi:hypothetical protein
MKASTSKLSRRNFLLTVGAGGVATVAAVAASSKPQGQSKKAAAAPGSKGYQLTEHVRKYYSTTKV